jgi:hypothetical protein
LFLCIIVPVVSSCHYRDGVFTELQPGGKNNFARIAVVSFQRMSPENDSAGAARCPLCGSILSTEKFPRDAEKVVESLFFDRLAKLKKFQLIPPDHAGAIYERISAESPKMPLMEILKKVGSELEADGVVFAYVCRYRERKGYPYSVELPASVAFEIHLVSTSDGNIAWKGIFDKTQKSLMENVLLIGSFFKGGGQWMTAKELAAEGINAILEKFPGFE